MAGGVWVKAGSSNKAVRGDGQSLLVEMPKTFTMGWYGSRDDARAFFDAWVATIDLTPETAPVPQPRSS